MKNPFNESRPYCVICPKALQDGFLALKEDLLTKGDEKGKRYLDLSLYTKEEAVSYFGLQKDPRSLKYLLQKGYDYEHAKELLEAFCAPFFEKANLPKLRPYVSLREELISLGYLWRYPNPEKDFSSKHLLIAGYSETKRLSETIGNSSNNLMVDFLAFPKKGTPKYYFSFKNIYEELHFVLNEIAHDIDKNHLSPNDIYLAGVTPEHYSYLRDLSSLYGFEIALPSTIRLFDHPAYRFFRERFLEEDYLSSLQETKEAFPLVSLENFEKKVVDFLDTFPEKDRMVALFDSFAKETILEKAKKKNAISLLQGFLAPQSAKVYCLHFAMGVYPSVFKDEGFLTSEEKEKLGLESAREKTKEDTYAATSLLESGQVKLLTFKDRAFDSSFFVSGLASSLHIEKADPFFQEYEYSHAQGAYFLSMLLDKKTDYDEEDARILPLKELSNPPFRLYDYKMPESVPFPYRSSFSQGSLNDYISCPFKYLLNRSLRLNALEDTWKMKLGTFFHKVLEEHYKDPSLSFEDLYKKAYEDLSRETLYSAKELFFLEHLKPYSYKNVLFFDELDKTLPSMEASLEGSFNTKLSNDISIFGRYDKIVSFEKGEKYLFVIDYKSGETTFDPDLFEKYGLDAQLPFYLCFAKNDERYKDFKVAGLFIAPLLKTPFNGENKEKYDENDLKAMRLDGIYLDDYPLWSNIGLWKKTSREINLYFEHMTLSKETGLSANKQAFSEEKFENLCKTLLSFLSKAKKGLEKGNYAISPLRLKNKDACQNCLYRDVCYRKENDFPLLSPKDGKATFIDEDSVDPQDGE